MDSQFLRARLFSWELISFFPLFFTITKGIILTLVVLFFSSLTLEGVRKALEKDMGLETYSLDAHKKFIKQCVDKVSSTV